MARTSNIAIAATAVVAALSCTTVTAITSPVLIKFRERQMQQIRVHAERLTLSKGISVPPDQYYTQTLDHFDVQNDATWQQRFWVNTQYFVDPSAPVFFYVEGEGAGSPYDVVSGEHVELAQQYGALLVALEHRFYGASIPTADLSTPNMNYLSSHQAIGDIAEFITSYLYPTFNITAGVNKIVTFGGSYPGALSAWTRLRLPHLIHAAFSTSSPVQAVADFQNYNNVVAASLSTPLVGGSPACNIAISQAFQAVDAAFTGTADERHAMATKLMSCTGLDGQNDTMWAASNYAGLIMGVVQYNDEEGGLNVQSVCETMLQPGKAPIDAFAQVVSSAQGSQCMDNSYADFLVQARNITADKSAGGVGIRQWTYQTCVSFGYYQSCEPGTQCPFSMLMTLDSSYQQCPDIFGPVLTQQLNDKGINFTNAVLGGQNIQGSRIIYVNGSIDPWHSLSVYNSTSSQQPSVFIQGTAHCRNMMPSSPNDPPALIAARQQINAYLATFLAE